MRAKAAVIMMMVLLTLEIAASFSFAGAIQEETYQRLDAVRRQKTQQLFRYLDSLQQKADAIKDDRVMADFFHLKNQYYQFQKLKAPSAALVKAIEELKQKINEHYLRHYLSFYDILFINPEGDIFYTIRKQSDYHKNIFKGVLADTALAKQLKSHPHETFVDYQYYHVSDEPSSFIVQPVAQDGAFAGWFALQCAINKINNMFTHEKGLGITGEVFLVNDQNYMLTDSRFFGESSILKKHLSRKNIEAKFREKSGHMIVTDYRGFRALSSFEVCQVANSKWLLIAKIDENEIITEQYRKMEENVRPRLLRRFSTMTPGTGAPVSLKQKPVTVDMDEFHKVHQNETIATFGVSTCTAVIVTLPRRFAYLSHISNLDRIYGGDTTDLIGHIFKRIKNFDIYKYEILDIQATVVANDLETIGNIISRLLAEGIFLSQIRFVYNPDARYANVLHDYNAGETFVEWLMDRNSGAKQYQRASSAMTVDEWVKPLIGYE